MARMIKDSTLFQVHHDTFATDTIMRGNTLVRAPSMEEAAEKFNLWSKNKRGFPYCYNKVTIDDVHEVRILK